MVFDFKYHITTIVSIFLALGIGILIGSTMIGDDGIVREQQRLIVQIEENLNSLRSQNNQYRTRQVTLESMVTEQGKFIDQLFQDAIMDKLAGLRCLLVADPRQQDGKLLSGVLKAAGMDVTDFTVLPENWQPADPASGWDLCLLMTQSMPPGIEQVFVKEQIFRPTVKNLTAKQMQYQVVKALHKLRPNLPVRLLQLEENEGGEERSVPDNLES